MTPTALAARHETQRGNHSPWLRLIIDHNPFYLLSAISMLLGCYLLNTALYTPAGDVKKLLVLLAVVNLYELLIIPLGVLLVRKPWPVKRDGATLLVLEALFLTDVTFTNGVISTVDARWGTLINLLILLLAAVKLWVILRALHQPKAARTCLFVLIQIAVLLMVPAVFKDMAGSRHGKLPPLVVYAAWCLAGLLPALGAILHQFPVRHRRIYVDDQPEGWISPLYNVVPYVSLLVHLYSAAWVYSIPFESAYVSPVLLGLAVAVGILSPKTLSPRLATRAQVAMGLLAVYLSTSFSESLTIVVGGAKGFTVSPLRVALFGAAVLFAGLLWRHRRYAFLVATAVASTTLVLGHSFAEIRASLERLGRWLYNGATDLVPRTSMEWGITAVGAAFLFLALGALFSLRRKPPPSVPTEADQAVAVHPST